MTLEELEKKITDLEGVYNEKIKALEEGNKKLSEENQSLTKRLADVRVDNLIKNVEEKGTDEHDEPIEFEFE